VKTSAPPPLFDERQEFAAFLPAVTFLYLYYLGREPSFIYLAIIFVSIASANIARKLHLKPDTTYEYIRDCLYMIPIIINDILGFPIAILVSWNNIVRRSLMVDSPIEYSEDALIAIVFEKVVSHPDIIIMILLFLNGVYFLVVVNKIVVSSIAKLLTKIFRRLKI
jgi:hypothetical protein